MATTTKNSLTVSSIAFSAGGHIPVKYSCEGENINPPLEITGFPEGTKTLAIIVKIQMHHMVLLITGLYGISLPMSLSMKPVFPALDATVLEKPATEALARLLVPIVIFSEYMRWMLNWICGQVQIKKPYRML